jgi:hypothetical protein
MLRRTESPHYAAFDLVGARPAGDHVRCAMKGPTRLVSRPPSHSLGRRVVVDDDEEIDIAVGAGLTARRRAEQDHPLWAKIRDHWIEQFIRDEELCHNELYKPITSDPQNPRTRSARTVTARDQRVEPPSASMTASGRLAMTVRKARAAPSGRR